MATSTKTFVGKHFVKAEGEENKWKCSCGKELSQKPNTGYSNLMTHVRNQHPKWLEEQAVTQPQITRHTTTSITSTTKTAKNVHGWLEWVCIGLKPFSFVEETLTRRYSNLAPITAPTLKKYMEKVTKAVERAISQELPNRFALAIDGWTKSSTHFIAIFATYPKQDSYATALLTFTPLGEETSFTAEDHLEAVKFCLETYNKDLSNVVALIADHASVNLALANMMEVPLVGCVSHKMNLAVNGFLEKYTEPLERVHLLMNKLKTEAIH